MKYLVLGGAGFQGRHLVERLVKDGGDVRVFDKNTSSPDTNHVEHIQGNFAANEIAESLLEGIDVVFHLISTTLPKTSNDDPSRDVLTNVIPTLRLLELARKNNVKKVIFFSSGGTVYGVPNTVPTPESHPTPPLCSYGIHKVAIENYLHLYFTLYGLDYAVMRVSNPYGTYQSTGKGQGAVSVFLDKLLRNEQIEIWGDGSVVRDYIHVDDVVEAAIKLVHYQGPHKVFNIGSGQGLSLNELIAELETISGRKALVNYLPGRALDVPISILDINRANRELNWRPQIQLHDGISRLVRDSQEADIPNTHVV